ncbi:MAG: HAMP domain-containing histidine kinase [Bacteroidales bacterium]|jgi:signal transduction histidine kinase|nr:HAMP domain-containing histidine kinase [Bacteroidales bacterium]
MLPDLQSINGESLKSRDEIVKLIAARKRNRKNTLDSLQREYDVLSNSKTSSYKEKVAVLHNIIDIEIVKMSTRVKYEKELLKIAQKNKDYSLEIETIEELINSDYNALDKYRKLLTKLPSGNEQKEVIALIDYKNIIKKFSNATEKEGTAALQKMINGYNDIPKSKIYDRAANLFGICMVMSRLSTNSLYQEYLQKLGDIMDELPADGRNFLPFAYHAAAANFYVKKDLMKSGYKIDMEMLRIENDADSIYKSKGRVYKSMELQRYVTYRRMLSYSSILSKAQVQDVYNKLVETTNRHPELYSEFHSNQSICSIRYLMAMERYKEAIPFLERVITNKKRENARKIQKECLKDMITAKVAIDKNADIQEYAEKYLDLLEEEKKSTLDEKNNEMQILYNMDNMEKESNKKILNSGIIFLAIVLILFAFAFYLLVRSQNLAGKLAESKNKLIKEKKDLHETRKRLDKAKAEAENASRLKTSFIQNMQHEIRTPLNSIVGFSKILADPSNKPSKEEAAKFNEIMRQNSALLSTTVSDILDISDLERGEYHIAPESLNEICTFVVNIFKGRAAQGVEMIFKAHDRDLIIDTDRERLIQVLLNFLSNSCKFTQSGKIVLDYQINNRTAEVQGKNGSVILSVTDTGIGIPEGKEEVIFNRFEKLNRFSQGQGLGLFICRLIAKGLHGKVMADATCSGGARFIFIHPLTQE